MSAKSIIPSYVQHAFWAYDIDSVDLKRDERMIITQVLNRGSAKAVRWLRQTYGDSKLAAVIQDPPRGLWFPQVLNFWATIFNITTQPQKIKRALMSVLP